MKFRCAQCGREFEKDWHGRAERQPRYCSTQCIGWHYADIHARKAMADDFNSDTRWPRLKAEQISDDAFVRLVSEIVDKAADDVVKLSEHAWPRQDAENFFLSDYFEALTGMEGWPVLDKLLDDADAYQRKRNERTKIRRERETHEFYCE